MIRIEIEISKGDRGKVEVFGRALKGCWCQTTAEEEKIADRVFAVMRRDVEDMSKIFGNVETFEGDAAEQAHREVQS